MLLASGLALLLTPGATPPEPGRALGEAIDVGGFRVTLLTVSRLSGVELQTRHGKAADGRRMIWLVEPRNGESERLVFGDVRLIAAGRQYNTVTNPTSTKPFSPDVIIHEFPEFAARHSNLMGQKPPAGRAHAVIVEVLIRGASLKPGELQSAALEVGTFESGAKPGPGIVPRYTWCTVTLQSD